MTRLYEAYNQTIRPALQKELSLRNVMQTPRLEKVVINVGVGDAKDNKKYLEDVVKNIATITGQKPVVTKAKQSIAGFKIRAGQPIGVRVTLRGERMYDFIDRLVSITFPRVRDFRGLSVNGFDGHGNYNLGLREHIIFPEIHFDSVDKVHGMNITIVTNAENDEQARALLTQLGFPFEKEGAR